MAKPGKAAAKAAEIAATAAATRAVVQIGSHGGRGFILAVGDKRYVVTAAHCFFDKLPYPHGARDGHEVTYENLIGPLGGKRLVSAECAKRACCRSMASGSPAGS
jgi:hypothetical protein